MNLSNGKEVTIRRYQEKDAEAIVNLIKRNFLEINVKDYGEEAMKLLKKEKILFGISVCKTIYS